MALARRHRQKLTVLFLDLDRFKRINDSLGHAIGDRLLQSVAQRLLACVRSSDTVSRAGGDEFVFLLSEVKHARDAAVSADKILLALSMPHRIEHHDLQVTGSIGIVTYPDDGMEDMAVLLALDDFGTGYSSLSHLKRLPIDILKIDRSFVRHLTTDTDDASIVRAVISMGKSLHMRVVAKGVETREQLAFLQEHSCPEGQGRYFSQPLGAGEFAQLLGRGVAKPSSPDGRKTRESPLDCAAAIGLHPTPKSSVRRFTHD